VALEGRGLTPAGEVGGVFVAVPSLDIHTIGAGGGSIGWRDAGGSLRVGPRSVGADPGPACYGKGDEAALADACVVLGRLVPRFFLSGQMVIDPDRSWRAVERLGRTLGLDARRTAEGMVEVALARTERACRRVSVERGADPRPRVLVAFGGAGGLLGPLLAGRLGMRACLVPAHPGLLCALGMAGADVVRRLVRTVLARVDRVPEGEIACMYKDLEAAGRTALAAEGFAEEAVDVAREVGARYEGQGEEIVFPYAPGLIAARFHERHERLNGYRDERRPVEVVTLRAAGSGARARRRARSGRKERGGRADGSGDARARSRGQGARGRRRVLGDHVRAARIRAPRARHRRPLGREVMSADIDPIALEVFRHRFAAIAEEMGETLRRASFSPNIKERRDYSCALFDARGDMVAQALHIPVHLGSMPLSVRAALDEHPDLAAGDMVLLNDPYRGGTHLPDLTLVAPVFDAATGALAYIVANRAHHADVGGMTPGSLPVSREVFQEGIRIPPVKVVRAGVADGDLVRLIIANCRAPQEREGDLRAQIAANRLGAARLADLERENGPLARLHATALLDYAERMMRAFLRSIPSGEHRFEDFLEDDGLGSGPVPIRVAVRLDASAGEATVDFTGTAPQVEGCVNANEAIALSATAYVFRAVAGAGPRGAEEQPPANAGALRPLRVIAPLGTLVNPRFPAAVAGGNVETSQRIVDVLLGALARALPGRVPAASCGTMSNLTIGGFDPTTGRTFAYYETIGGGSGASPSAPGASGIQTHMTNTLNTPVEALEHAYPFRVRRYHLRRSSGGQGLHAGGDGIVREIEVLAPCDATLLTERRTLAPYGLAGGNAGAPGRNTLVRADGREELLPAKITVRLAPGDAIRVETPGGGGWGA
jgi:N-methylhydantoinase B/oxoprolinase/acetone carboxylase alpha subunit